ncbi:hypothetical protein OUZ56_031262 [Daphnia magna]|uniref:Uncharacterized protein n=1 Tax=Daphnia magna TaxID=35525 RepID=A0ABQ9ZU52_9CRUS|nr:hypothetical protein OUZ56_031262 [Daphnia magna]
MSFYYSENLGPIEPQIVNRQWSSSTQNFVQPYLLTLEPSMLEQREWSRSAQNVKISEILWISFDEL